MPTDSDKKNNTDPQPHHHSRRKHLRHPSAINATVYSDAACKLSATISNISYEGLQLELDKTSAEQLLKPSTDANDHQHTRISVEFIVNNKLEQPSVIHILCRVVHIENCKGQLLIGLEHRDIEEGVIALSEFIIAQ